MSHKQAKFIRQNVNVAGCLHPTYTDNNYTLVTVPSMKYGQNYQVRLVKNSPRHKYKFIKKNYVNALTCLIDNIKDLTFVSADIRKLMNG